MGDSKPACHGSFTAESTFEKVDSRNALFANATSMDCHADKSARNDSELDSSVDCHANASAFARNDYKNAALQNKDSSTEANLNEPAQDSSNEVQNIANSAKDSKILELESWLCEPRKEDKTSGLSTQRGEAIRDSSPKAESLVDFPPP